METVAECAPRTEHNADAAQAAVAASLDPAGKPLRLSLTDRCCMAFVLPGNLIRSHRRP